MPVVDLVVAWIYVNLNRNTACWWPMHGLLVFGGGLLCVAIVVSLFLDKKILITAGGCFMYRAARDGWRCDGLLVGYFCQVSLAVS